jgi:hypothetical protein
VATLRSGLHNGQAVVLVEMIYVTLTAGLYAGLQQKALGFRSILLGNITIVVGVPGLSLALDWLAHVAVGAPAPARATFAVCIFALISALFHLHVMRRGVFLTGGEGHSLADDFRRIPRLIASFATAPVLFLAFWMGRMVRAADSLSAL